MTRRMTPGPPQEHRPAPPARALWAYAGPFALFILLQTQAGLLRSKAPGAPWWLAAPEFWVYPLQTLVCGTMLLWFRREYPRAVGPWAALTGAAAGLLVFALWVSPQAVFHAAPRLDGFDPTRLADPLAYRLAVGLRFARLVVVVPWLEEVFWRGFLLRYFIKEDFLAVPFGAWTPLSFGAVAAGFMLEHQTADYPAALATGVLYNLVAVRTKSLPACVLAHALTNLLLGIYVMQTRQWGFW